MTAEGPFERDAEGAPNHPSPITQRSNFQWTAAFDAASLTAGWQDHLTRYLAASAAVSVSFDGQHPLLLFGARVVGDHLHVYQITTHALAVEVQVSYRSLGQAGLDEPYGCHLVLKTEVGSRVVTLPLPTPPSPAEWKQVLRQLWFQLLMAEDALLVMPGAAPASAQGQPLYTFKLRPELDWEESAPNSAGGTRSEWQHELRLTLDPAEPGTLRAQVGWHDAQLVSNPALESVPAATASSRARITKPLKVNPLLRLEYGWGRLRVRMAALIAAILLLTVMGGVVLGAIRGAARTNLPLAVSNQTPTAGQTPSGIPSATPGATNAPTVQPSPTGTARTPVQPTPRSTATPTPTPTSTPTPTPTTTPTPTPTTTPAPSPTPTP